MKSATCSACGNDAIVSGSLQSTGTLHFRPSGVKFMTFHTADITVTALMCKSCGHLQLRGDLEKLHLIQDLPAAREAATSNASSR